jgi:esterase/lipase superfamily enzyme
MMRWLVLIVALVACSPRGEITMMPGAEGTGPTRSVFVATSRGVDDRGRFDGRRSETVRFAHYDVLVPPGHDMGSIIWPRRGRAPDPETDFLTVSEVRYTSALSFRGDLRRALMRGTQGERRAAGGREAVIFVHGFNNTFAEGLYRIAQLSQDLEMPGVTVHYSWPSAGRPLAYVQDRDSALFARDGLETLIREVAAAGAERIFLVAHSMGATLTMEALRQIALRGDGGVQRRVGGVLLISPDIDVDVFRLQAREIGTLPQPFVIFGSKRDRALNLSARITGQPERLGNLTDISRLADLTVTYLDTAAYSQGDGHFNLGNSPALLSLIGRISDVNAAFDADRTGRTGLLPGVVLTVQNATEIILSPVTVIADELAEGNARPRCPPRPRLRPPGGRPLPWKIARRA